MPSPSRSQATKGCTHRHRLSAHVLLGAEGPMGIRHDKFLCRTPLFNLVSVHCDRFVESNQENNSCRNDNPATTSAMLPSYCSWKYPSTFSFIIIQVKMKVNDSKAHASREGADVDWRIIRTHAHDLQAVLFHLLHDYVRSSPKLTKQMMSPYANISFLAHYPVKCKRTWKHISWNG